MAATVDLPLDDPDDVVDKEAAGSVGLHSTTRMIESIARITLNSPATRHTAVTVGRDAT